MAITLTKRKFVILVLTLIAAFVHLVVLNLQMQKLDLLFTLNGLGYLTLLAAYLLPFLQQYRNLVRWALMGFAAVTIVAWIAIGDKTWPAGALGYFTKLDELALIVTLWLDK